MRQQWMKWKEEIKEQEERTAAAAAETEAEVLDVWRQIRQLVLGDDPAAFEHCSRPFCACHDLRPIVFPEK